MQAPALEGGFRDAPTQAADAFRQIMNVVARPGVIARIEGATPPAPLSIAAGTAVLTLCDADTGLHLAGQHDTPQLRDWITFHTGAPIVPPGEALFALGTWDALPLADFAIGTPEYPDRSTTVLVALEALTATGATLRGPGIKDRASLSLPETAAFARNADLFPLGLDFIFTAGDRIAALPRSTKVSQPKGA